MKNKIKVTFLVGVFLFLAGVVGIQGAISANSKKTKLTQSEVIRIAQTKAQAKKIDLEKSYIMITNKKYSRKNLSMKFIREQILGK